MDKIRIKYSSLHIAAQLLVEVYAGGKLSKREKVPQNPSTSQIKKLSVNLGIPYMFDGLQAAIVKFEVDSGKEPTKEMQRRYELEVPAADLAAPPSGYFVREITADKDTATKFNTFEDALSAANALPGERVIEWENKAATTAVDVDYHDGTAPADLGALAIVIEPKPVHWWLTKSGGLRLIYHAGGGFTADELAAVAVAQLVIDHGIRGSIELNRRTRRPPNAKFQTLNPSYNCGWLARMLGDYSDAEERIADWLDSKGLVPGQRYPHTQCPADPRPAALTNTPPVVVTAKYVKCYVCEKEGKNRDATGKLLHRDPGYFPLHTLAGTAKPTLLAHCLANATHWDHASFVLAREMLSVPVTVRRSVYKAMLRMANPDDLRIDRVFAETPCGLIRFRGVWSTLDGQHLRLNKDSPLLASLPAAYTPKGEFVRSVVEELSQPIDLTLRGYPAITPIWGIRLTERQEQPDTLATVVYPDHLRLESVANRRPKYVHASERMPLDEAWGVIDRAFPKINRNAVTLLIAAKGCSEHRAGLPPMIFFSGPTGAGKTAIPGVAAGILGDSVHRIPYERDTNRVFAAISTARATGSFCNFDEFIKGAERAKIDPINAMNFALELDEGALTHRLYVGAVKLGTMPVYLWTDTIIPAVVQQASQIGRRMHYVALTSTHDWTHTLANEGITTPERLRLASDPQFATAADAILSDVRDRFFSGAATDFADVAERLGFTKLNKSDLAQARHAAVRLLFRHVCDKTEGVTDATLKRCIGDPGWRQINVDGDSVAASLWEACGTIAELDLQAVLNTKYPVRCETHKRENLLAIRFTDSHNNVNEAIT